MRVPLMVSVLAVVVCLLGTTSGVQINAAHQTILQNWYSSFSFSNLNWKLSTNLCQGAPEVFCDGSGNVLWLQMGSKNIIGNIASSLGQISSLQKLILGQNQLSGTIPSEIAAAPLQQFDISANSISGTIPTQFGSMKYLTTFLAPGNKLTNFPTELGSSVLGTLDLRSNQITGALPTEIALMTNLYSIQLSYNALTGTIPNAFINTHAVVVDFSNNELYGSIPAFASNQFNSLLLTHNAFCPIVNYTTMAVTTDYTSSDCTSCPSFTICQNGGSCMGGSDTLFSCACSAGFTGTICSTPCNCGVGYHTNTCNATGFCDCNPNFSDAKCTACEPTFYLTNSTCSPCSCSAAGSSATTCDSSGKCSCTSNFAGSKCDQCVPAKYGPGCTSNCGCSVGAISVSCNISTGACSCSSNFVDSKCSVCAPTYYSTTPSGSFCDGTGTCVCSTCDCYNAGSTSGNCSSTGVCSCGTGFTGNKCDQCLPGFNGVMCGAIYCQGGYEPTLLANFPKTQATLTAVGTCTTGYGSTGVSRVCNQVGGSGFWATTVTNPCQPCDVNTYENNGVCVNCPSFSTSPAQSSGVGSCTCNSGYIFNVTTLLCDVVTCSANSVNGTAWQVTANGVLANGTCFAGYTVFQGTQVTSVAPKRQCVLNGDGKSASWASQDVSCEQSCAIVGCQRDGTCVGNIACNCISPSNGRFCENSGQPTCAQISCLNGGACVPGQTQDYPATCNCTGTGYQGATCTVDVNDCLSLPCLNGGLCSDAGANAFTCDCSGTEYIGTVCQTETITCTTNPCQHGGACSHPAPNTVACSCTGTGYTGSSCQTPVVGDCRVPAYPCQNTGVCRVSAGDVGSCDCNGTLFTGSQCQLETISCTPNPCQNGGLCTDTGVNSFTCDCSATQFQGTLCDAETVTCSPNPCQNGGVCSHPGLNDVSCNCTGTGYEGTNCQAAVVGDCRASAYSCENFGVCEPGSNNSATCNCAGTGATGTRCQTDLNDCLSTPCQNGGVCTDTGLNSFRCDCTGLAYKGDLCQSETVVCTPSTCLNSGACYRVAANHVACRCNGTGYSGNDCSAANFGDCRVTGQTCQNQGVCAVQGSGDGTQCSCSARYVGATCNIDLAALIAVPVALGLALVSVLVLKRRYPEADNMIVMTVVLAVYDFVTDCIFVYSQHTLPNGAAIFYSSIAFVAIPMVFNLVVIAAVVGHTLKKNPELEVWLNEHYGVAAGTIVLSSTQIEVFGLLRSKLLGKEVFSAPIKDQTFKTVIAFGILGNVVEDLPQLVIQILVASNKVDTVVVLSIIASILTISMGLVKRLLLFALVRLGANARRAAKKAGATASSGEETEISAL